MQNIWIFLDMIVIIYPDIVHHNAPTGRRLALGGSPPGWHLKWHPGWDVFGRKLGAPIWITGKKQANIYKNRRFQMISSILIKHTLKIPETFGKDLKIILNDGQKSSYEMTRHREFSAQKGARRFPIPRPRSKKRGRASPQWLSPLCNLTCSEKVVSNFGSTSHPVQWIKKTQEDRKLETRKYG